MGMMKISSFVALASAPALLVTTLWAGTMNTKADAPIASIENVEQIEHVTFEEPLYLIVDQVDGEEMATGALDVQEVTFEEPMNVRLYRSVPGV